MFRNNKYHILDLKKKPQNFVIAMMGKLNRQWTIADNKSIKVQFEASYACITIVIYQVLYFINLWKIKLGIYNLVLYSLDWPYPHIAHALQLCNEII